jgi:hypothetical protein
MKTKPFMNGAINGILLVFPWLLASFLLLNRCAGSGPKTNASMVKFTYEGENFRIRSLYSSDRTECQNELIGSGYLAVDYDQDGVIDGILLGKADLAEAQRAYEYGLSDMAKRSRLMVVGSREAQYVLEQGDFRFEIKSLRPFGLQPFNEFLIFDKRQTISPGTTITVDKNADGILDDVMKGAKTVEKFQSQYAQAVETGLREGKLARINGTILVREK